VYVDYIIDRHNLKARYKCLKCGHKYEIEPEAMPCPMCKHLYIKWLNYEDMHKIWIESGSDLYRKIYA